MASFTTWLCGRTHRLHSHTTAVSRQRSHGQPQPPFGRFGLESLELTRRTPKRYLSTACSSCPGDLESWPLPGKHRNHPGPPQQQRPFRNQGRRSPRHRSYRCRPLQFRRRTTYRSWLLRPGRPWSRNPEEWSWLARPATCSENVSF